MPAYDYQCKNCGHEFERQLVIANRNIPLEEPCPGCGQKSTITKMISGMAIGDPVSLGLTRPDAAFRNRLREIHDRPGATPTRARYTDNITEV
jgi:putative FmdB family regulatory protein